MGQPLRSLGRTSPTQRTPHDDTGGLVERLTIQPMLIVTEISSV